ncbi:MAG: hypothetical protein KBC60_04125 [Haliscomenobacter sp.]|nr:hypothetical protein [Haliscomenobacter sp.]
MKKWMYAAGLIAALITGSVQFFSFTPLPDPTPEAALEQSQQQFRQGLEALKQAIARYVAAGDQWAGDPAGLPSVQEAHLQTRLAFKQVELWMEYFDREAVKRYVNGPPLPSIDLSKPGITILQPQGLQVLDELLFGEEAVQQKDSILQQVRTLQINFNDFYLYQRRLAFQHRFVLEAIRYELLRIYTLGLTGFDTPGSGNAMPEATVAFEACYKHLQPYLPLIKEKDPKLAAELGTRFQGAVKYLAANDEFDTFDRLAFLRKYLNPLYAGVLAVHKALGVETVYETTTIPQAVNYNSDKIFDTRFFDTRFFFNNQAGEHPEKRIALGKMLFFDPILSGNNKRSCASCHLPGRAFTDGLPKSKAIDEHGFIMRNAPTLINAVYAENYFLDLREPALERQIKHVVMDENEFNTNFDEIVGKLKQSAEYLQLFEAAYADVPAYALSPFSVSDALAAYVATLTSFNSAFDRYARGETNAIDPAVARGYNLFMGKAACGTCHFAPTFNGNVPPYYEETDSEVLGVPAKNDTVHAQLDPDLGRYASSRPHDETAIFFHAFKTTTVRNVQMTGPYMHNGVYNTLDEVVDFYNRGGGAGIGIELPNQTLPPDPLNLTPKEMKDLVAFMHALTDFQGLADMPQRLPRFENQAKWNERQVIGAY